jgi:hypothetical protein
VGRFLGPSLPAATRWHSCPGHQPRSTSRYGLCAMPLHWCPYARCVASRCVVALPRPLPTPPQLPASVSAAPLLPPRSQPLRRTPAAERYRRIRSAADAARAGARALRASRAARSLALGLGHQPLDHAPAALLPALARTLALALEAHSGRVAPLNTLQHAPGIGALGRGHHPPDDAAEGPLAARVRPSLARPLLGRRRRRPLLGALVELRLHPSLWHLCGKRGGRWMVGTSV